MAFVIAIAFVLSGLTYIPKTASAEEAAPTVKVLGATLRLSKDGVDNIGTQSMRIGIQVNNADQAKDCAIKLTVGDKVRIIGTSSTTPSYAEGDNVQYFSSPSLYSKDESSNTVVYAITITGIPTDNFNSSIAIEGITDNGSDEPIAATGENKSVDTIVSELKTRYPALNIVMLGGTLYTGNGEDKLAAKDILDYNPDLSTNPDGSGWNADKTEYTIPLNENTVQDVEDVNDPKNTTFTFREDGSVHASTFKHWDGFKISPVAEISDYTISKVTIAYTGGTGNYITEVNYGNGDTKLYPPDCGWPPSKGDQLSGNGTISYDIDSSKKLSYIKFFSQNGTDLQEGQIYSEVTITKVTFTVKPEEISSSSETGVDISETAALYGKGTVTPLKDGNSTGVIGKNVDGLRIPLGQEVNPGDSVAITVYGNASTGMRMWLSDSTNKRWSNIENPANFKNTYTFTADNNIENESAGSEEPSAKYFLIKGPNVNASFDTITITKVVVEKVETPIQATYEIDLNDSSSYKLDGNGSVPVVTQNESGGLNFNCNEVTGVIFQIPDDQPHIYKYCQITYSSDNNSWLYFYGHNMTGTGQMDSTDIHEVTAGLPSTNSEEQTITYDITQNIYSQGNDFGENSMKAIKIFAPWGPGVNLYIKSIKFFAQDPTLYTSAPDI